MNPLKSLNVQESLPKTFQNFIKFINIWKKKKKQRKEKKKKIPRIVKYSLESSKFLNNPEEWRLTHLKFHKSISI